MVSQQVFLVFVVLFVVCCSQSIFAAPNSLQERQDLVERFAEFLHEDKELSAALEKLEWNEDQIIRNRRQANGELDDGDFGSPPQEKPGFFDRAAKFVTELLQRFLKWINSSENN